MAAFPTIPTAGSLHEARDLLRLELHKLNALLAQATGWVEDLERDRVLNDTNFMVPEQPGLSSDESFDAAFLPRAEALLTFLTTQVPLLIEDIDAATGIDVASRT